MTFKEVVTRENTPKRGLMIIFEKNPLSAALTGKLKRPVTLVSTCSNYLQMALPDKTDTMGLTSNILTNKSRPPITENI